MSLSSRLNGSSNAQTTTTPTSNAVVAKTVVTLIHNNHLTSSDAVVDYLNRQARTVQRAGGNDSVFNLTPGQWREVNNALESDNGAKANWR